MKFTTIEESGEGKDRLVMHVGIDEARLLFGLVAHAKAAIPKTIETTRMLGRLRHIQREFQLALNKTK